MFLWCIFHDRAAACSVTVVTVTGYGYGDSGYGDSGYGDIAFYCRSSDFLYDTKKPF